MKVPTIAALSLIAFPAALQANTDPVEPLININFADDVSVQLGGRIQLDVGFVSTDDASFDGRDGVEFRRARLFAKGKIGDNVKYKAQYDFAGASVSFADVYMQLTEFPLGTLTVGHFKEPFGLESLTSSRFTTFHERAAGGPLVPSRNVGIMAADQMHENMNWALGIFRDTGNDGEDLGDGEYSVTGRLVFRPKHSESNVLHLGLAASTRGDDDGVETFAARPNYHNHPTIASISQPSDGTTLLGVEAAWTDGPLTVQGEFQTAAISGDGVADSDVSNYYMQGSYWVRGGSDNYNPAIGSYARPNITESYGENGIGGIQLAARYDMTDFNDGAGADELSNITVGVNWWLNSRTRWSLNYINSTLESGAVDDSADILSVRFQVDF